jgi:uncharacterized membrane protein
LSDPLVFTILEYGHIISAIGWLGGSLLTGLIIGPGLQTLTAPSRLEFIAKLIPKIVRYVRGMIVGTFLFGLLLLYYWVGGDFSMLSPSTGFGAALSAGIGIALIAAVLAFTVVLPSFGKMASIAAEVLKSGGQPPPPEMMKYATRARVSSMVGLVLLLLAVVMMVAAGFY